MKMMKKTDAWGVSSSSLCRHGAMALTPPAITARFMSSLDESPPTFQRGDSILIEVMSFGPLGASVQVVGLSHSPNALIPEDEMLWAVGSSYRKKYITFDKLVKMWTLSMVKYFLPM
jgi:hypothetical protein